MSAETIRAAFRDQGKSCAMLGSPFMGRLMSLMADRLTSDSTVGARVLAWQGDVSSAGQSIPLRLAGALHGLILDGLDAKLTAAYPPNTVSDEALWAAVDGAFTRHEARLMEWLDQFPQTNEVRRASALLPALWHLDEIYGLPLVLSELGASAGLNLSLGRFALHAPGGIGGPADSPVQLQPDWRGDAPPAPRTLAVAEAAGVDRNPLDPHDPVHALRLTAYLWPDQPHRLALTRGAIWLAGAPPDAGDAAPWLAARLAEPHPGHLHVVFTTVAWQYFPPETQAAATAALEAAGAKATRAAPLAHVSLEADGRPEGAALTLRHWPDAPEPHCLGRADFHGRWVDWRG
ncbi:DUF2332 family protein [Roseibacterium beibuensis]|nr:DUF2332 family protein [Roseibacterium beibuensis]MCS6622478.1 DUF2332 family protein [Roseibacterium beibuensis]